MDISQDEAITLLREWERRSAPVYVIVQHGNLAVYTRGTPKGVSADSVSFPLVSGGRIDARLNGGRFRLFQPAESLPPDIQGSFKPCLSLLVIDLHRGGQFKVCELPAHADYPFTMSDAMQ